MSCTTFGIRITKDNFKLEVIDYNCYRLSSDLPFDDDYIIGVFKSPLSFPDIMSYMYKRYLIHYLSIVGCDNSEAIIEEFLLKGEVNI